MKERLYRRQKQSDRSSFLIARTRSGDLSRAEWRGEPYLRTDHARCKRMQFCRKFGGWRVRWFVGHSLVRGDGQVKHGERHASSGKRGLHLARGHFRVDPSLSSSFDVTGCWRSWADAGAACGGIWSRYSVRSASRRWREGEANYVVAGSKSRRSS